MIGHLRGTALMKDPEYLVVDVGGVGYRVHVLPDVLANTPERGEVQLWTHMVVRENAHELYGFSQHEELRFFELLIGVSGVGPKSALSILSLADVATLTSAIASGDTSYLTKVSGIGAKSAKKIVLELSDKFGGGAHDPSLQADTDTIDALVAMGYSQAEARDALKHVSREITGSSARLKEALKQLAA